MKNKLLLYANYYHNMGMNISPIHDGGRYKNPTDENWESFIDKEQSIQYIQSNSWTDATGVGCILGYNEYRALDIDGLYCSQEDLLFKENREVKVRKFISECLNILKLPMDYQWVVKSGSGLGLHIIFQTRDVAITEQVYAYNLSEKFNDYGEFYGDRIFRFMEFRCNAFLVLPPSIHDSENKKYIFYHNLIPTYKPFTIDISDVHNLLNHFCADPYFADCTFNNVNLKLVRNLKSVVRNASESYEITKVDEDINIISNCHNSDAYNTLGCLYALGKGLVKNLDKSIDYFKRSNNEMAHYNLASLIACGAINGTIDKIKYHLSFCPKIEQTYIDVIENNMKHLPVNNEIQDFQKSKKNKYLFFDTETTGLPLDYNSASSNIDNWPRLIQLSWIITDEVGNIIKEQDYIVYPEDFVIPIEAANINRITTKKAKEVGVPIKVMLDLFLTDFNKINYIVGHNIAFDKKIIGAELIRLGRQDIMDTKISYCTMEASIDYCKISGYFGYKYPKLQELYNKLFGYSFKEEHNSAFDVSATKKCFWEMKKRGVV